MKPLELSTALKILPEKSSLTYYPGQEHAWLLSKVLKRNTLIRDLRKTPFGRLIDEPLFADIKAHCGGIIDPVFAKAMASPGHAWHLRNKIGWSELSAFDSVYDLPWTEFPIWYLRFCEGYQQSREGTNLVVALGAPSVSTRVLSRFFTSQDRKDLPSSTHFSTPRTGLLIGWVRIDVDFETGTALIEEVPITGTVVSCP